MANQWFKFYGADYLSDQKMLSLSASERSCWITLLAYASLNGGVVKHLNETQLMNQAGLDVSNDNEWQNVVGVLKRFEKLEMIRIDNEVITVLNWQKRQEVYSESYLRLKKWREKKRDEALHDNGKNRIDKIRIDKNRKDKKIPLRGSDAKASQAKGGLVVFEKPTLKLDDPVNKLITLFKAVNPGYQRLYVQGAQRESIKRLVKQHGEQRVAELIEVLPKVITQKYAPVITTPMQLESKQASLAAFIVRESTGDTKHAVGQVSE